MSKRVLVLVGDALFEASPDRSIPTRQVGTLNDKTLAPVLCNAFAMWDLVERIYPLTKHGYPLPEHLEMLDADAQLHAEAKAHHAAMTQLRSDAYNLITKVKQDSRNA